MQLKNHLFILLSACMFFLLWIQTASAEGAYENVVLGVIYRNYTNYQGTVADGTCCDNPTAREPSCPRDRCDTSLKPCATRDGGKLCDAFFTSRMPVMYNVNSFQLNKRIGNGKNVSSASVVFRYHYTPGSINFTIVADDMDEGGDGEGVRIATFSFVVDWLDPLFRNPPRSRQMLLKDKHAELGVDIVHQCFLYQYGPKCDVYCKRTERYTCSDKGEKICREGWMGVNCDVMVPFCNSTVCQNGGTCTNVFLGYTCSCLELYSGTRCEISPTLSASTSSNPGLEDTSTTAAIESIKTTAVQATTTTSPITLAATTAATTIQAKITTAGTMKPLTITPVLLKDSTPSHSGVTPFPRIDNTPSHHKVTPLPRTNTTPSHSEVTPLPRTKTTPSHSGVTLLPRTNTTPSHIKVTPLPHTSTKPSHSNVRPLAHTDYTPPHSGVTPLPYSYNTPSDRGVLYNLTTTDPDPTTTKTRTSGSHTFRPRDRKADDFTTTLGTTAVKQDRVDTTSITSLPVFKTTKSKSPRSPESHPTSKLLNTITKIASTPPTRLPPVDQSAKTIKTSSGIDAILLHDDTDLSEETQKTGVVDTHPLGTTTLAPETQTGGEPGTNPTKALPPPQAGVSTDGSSFLIVLTSYVSVAAFVLGLSLGFLLSCAWVKKKRDRRISPSPSRASFIDMRVVHQVPDILTPPSRPKFDRNYLLTVHSPSHQSKTCFSPSHQSKTCFSPSHQSKTCFSSSHQSKTCFSPSHQSNTCHSPGKHLKTSRLTPVMAVHAKRHSICGSCYSYERLREI